MTFKTKFKIGEEVRFRTSTAIIKGVLVFAEASFKVIEYCLDHHSQQVVVKETDLLTLNPR